MDLEKVETLLKLMRTHQVSELEIKENDESVRLVLAQSGGLPLGALPLNHMVQTMVPQMPMPSYSPQEAVTHKPAVVSRSSSVKEIRSPFVGTFYRSASPGSDPFVEVGTRVKKGATLCIVEAMKLMNEIEADQDGVIVEILTTNESPVEYNQLLFLIE